MNTPVDSNSSPAVPATSKPPRNPVERMVVWGGIGLLLVVVMLEFRAQRGYAQTLDALNATAANEEHETTLNEAMQVLTLSPAVSDPVPSGAYNHIDCSWFSLFKNGQYKITLVCSRDQEPVLLAFTTPNPPAEPEPEVTPYAEDGASPASPSAGGGMGMGMGSEGMGAGGPGGGGMGGGARRPNPVRDAIDADADGSLSAEEIAASSTALAKLDQDTDGSLSSEELTPPPAADAAPGGAGSPAPPAGGGAAATGGGARRPNRLVAAIDTNEDGAISAEELAAAPTGLKSLDADSDGTIAADELRPPGGFGPGAGGGGAGADRPRRPGGEESTSPAVETPIPAPAEAPAPTGDAVPPTPATGTP